MKKSLYALIVVILSTIGAHALAEKVDMNVQKHVARTMDKTGNDNAGGKGCATIEK